jgi:NADH dehydrogenase [ubiquinone] 1 alpha subcomplex assembly factor 7
MTALKTRLIQRIARHGPMTLAEYMAECLLHPELGYYTHRDPLGRRAISSPRPRSPRCSAS